MSAPGGSSVVLAGFMTKRGKVVKSWKRRFMVLLSNGKLLYFTKPRAGWDSTPPSEWEPVDWDNSEPKGTLNVVSDVLELVHWDQTKEDGLVVWEKKTPPYTGFCLKAKRGRIWSIYAESTEGCDIWTAAILKLRAGPLRDQYWYKQWRLSVSGTIEQCEDWGASRVHVVGILGEPGKNFATFAEWGPLTDDLKAGIRENRLRFTAELTFNRVEVQDLESELAIARDTVYVIVASAPSQHFDKATELIRATAQAGNRNCMKAFGRVDDMSGLESAKETKARKLFESREGTACKQKPVGVEWTKSLTVFSHADAGNRRASAVVDSADHWVEVWENERHWPQPRGWTHKVMWPDPSHWSNAKGRKAQPPHEDAKPPAGTVWAKDEDEWYCGDFIYAFDFPNKVVAHQWSPTYDASKHYVRRRVWRRGIEFLPGQVERSPLQIILDGWGEIAEVKHKAWKRRFLKLRPASVKEFHASGSTHTLEYFKSDTTFKADGSVSVIATKTTVADDFKKLKGGARRCLVFRTPDVSDVFISPDGDRAEWVDAIADLKVPLQKSGPSEDEARADLASPTCTTADADYSQPPPCEAVLGVSIAAVKHLHTTIKATLVESPDTDSMAYVNEVWGKIILPEADGNASWAAANWSSTSDTGKNYVGFATDYVSWAPEAGIVTLLDALLASADGDTDQYFWIDILCDSSAISSTMDVEAELDTALVMQEVRNRILQCGRVVIVATPFHEPHIKLQLWCLLEAVEACSLLDHHSIEVISSPQFESDLKSRLVDEDFTVFQKTLKPMNSSEFLQTPEKPGSVFPHLPRTNSSMIVSEIESKDGGFLMANQLYSQLLTCWIMGAVTQLIKSEEGEFGAAASVNLACAAAEALFVAGDPISSTSVLSDALDVLLRTADSDLECRLAVLRKISSNQVTLGDNERALSTSLHRACLQLSQPRTPISTIFVDMGSHFYDCQRNGSFGQISFSKFCEMLWKIEGDIFPFTEAEGWFVQALAITTDILGPDHALVAKAKRSCDAAMNARINPLLFATSMNNLRIVTKLIETSVDVDGAREVDGATPLYIAAQKGNIDLVKALVQANANVNKCISNKSITPLIASCQVLTPHVDVAKLLIAANADVNLATSPGNVTALAFAAHRGDGDLCSTLISASALVDSADEAGRTPLLLAAEQGHEDVVKRLIRMHKANPNLATESGWTPLRAATKRRHHGVVNILRANGATDSTGGTRLSAHEIDLEANPDPIVKRNGGHDRPQTLYSVYFESGDWEESEDDNESGDEPSEPQHHTPVAGVASDDGMLALIAEQEAAEARRLEVEMRQRVESKKGWRRGSGVSKK